MLAMTRKTGYALMAMAHLARLDEGQVVPAREIAAQFDAPRALLTNVLKELAAARYVESVRGARGGYRLACDPQTVSLADVMAALEGPVRLAECITDQTPPEAECTCRVMARCPVAGPIHRVHRKLSDFLKKVTLAEVLALPVVKT